jgi:hypothetical protein
MSARGWPIVDISQLSGQSSLAREENILKNANHPRLCLVEDDVVDLVVAMHKRAPVLGLRLGVAEEGHHLVKVRDLADRLARVLILGLHLRVLDGVERLELSVVEA